LAKTSIKIGITIGDPAGIGPEVTLRALSELGETGIIPIVIGRYEVLKQYYSDLLQGYRVIDSKHESLTDITSNNRYIYNMDANYPIPTLGKGDIRTGIESKEYIDKSIGLLKSGFVDAIVTGPVNKGLIEKSGCHFMGHTEYIAEFIKEEDPYMLMYSENYRVLLVSTHIPISDIHKCITYDKLYRTILMGHKAISLIDGKDGKDVKLAIAGLDPHCGDGGAIGNFDIDVTERAVEIANADGINIEGPFSADTLFLPKRWKSYDLIIAHFHDQGLTPFKILTFDSGVNVTLGLSIIRTSVAHGTAYDIAGKGIANCGSMKEAIKLAYRLTKNRVLKV